MSQPQSLTEKYYPSLYFSVADVEFDNPTLTISSITAEEMNNRTTGRTETKPVLWFEESDKGLVLSRGRCEQLEKLFGKDPRSCKEGRVLLKLEQVRGMSTISIQRAAPEPAEKPEEKDLPF